MKCVQCKEYKSAFIVRDVINKIGLCIDCHIRFNDLEEIYKAAEEVVSRYYTETLPMYMKFLKDNLAGMKNILED